MSSFNLRGSYLDGHGAGEALGNGYDFWNYWDQPEASALLFGTPPSQSPLNLESMDVHPSPLAHQPGGVNLMFQIVKAKDANVRNEQAFNHFSAARPGSSRSSNITETDKKGQEMEAAIDQVARKRMYDRAYRERCKEKVVKLAKENARLKKARDEAIIKQQNAEQEFRSFREELNLRTRHLDTLFEILSRIRADMVNFSEGKSIRQGQMEVREK